MEENETGENFTVDHQVDEPLIEALSASEARHIQSLDEDENSDEDVVPDVLDMPPTELRGVIEALLLVSNRPVKIERIEKCLPGSCKNYLSGFLRGLSERYAREQRGWDLRSVGGGWQLLTRVQFHPWVRQLDKRELPTRLSKSAMETLAIVAYKQPVSRGRIEDIRGVQCGPMLRQLMDMHLILVTGRDEEALGRPLLYATTEQFLERFGLSAAEDLPRQHEFGA
ncbi:MAG: SMC-Scp complex subunit ScpB [Planctomycetes bacterium]|nr:SMC-Scp complex subunit ScpB [Planctomycetota bacterium]